MTKKTNLTHQVAIIGYQVDISRHEFRLLAVLCG
jgi:hypothetical protein